VYPKPPPMHLKTGEFKYTLRYAFLCTSIASLCLAAYPDKPTGHHLAEHRTCSVLMMVGLCFSSLSLGDFVIVALGLVQEVYVETGYVCGSMRAENVPQAKTPVVTFWEGDIIDNVNHSFITTKWGADKKIDVKHWPRFDGFQALRKRVQNSGGRCNSWFSLCISHDGVAA